MTCYDNAFWLFLWKFLSECFQVCEILRHCVSHNSNFCLYDKEYDKGNKDKGNTIINAENEGPKKNDLADCIVEEDKDINFPCIT